ncbi:MAG TPA: Uma2 family endonuclease [Thermoanaerobaculia bacterium]
MALHDRPVRLSYDDYVLIPEDGQRHEIIDGEHYVSPAPTPKHQEVLLELAVALRSFIKANRLGKLYVAPIDVVLSFYDVVQPDLVFISKERLHILTRKNIQGGPDLAIEILSDGTRRIDEGIKHSTYERFGVKEYWLVDPGRETVAVHRLEGGRFHKTADLAAAKGDVLTTPLLPGLEIRLAEIFA